MHASRIQYHDYLLLLAFMEDREFSRLGDPSNSVLRTVIPDSFNKSCREYYKSLETRFRDCRCAQGKSTDGPTFAQHLYDPQCLVAFGVSDFAGLVLMDDFDPLFSITADLNTSIEQVSLAFCPKTSSLGLEDGDSIYLRDLHDCFNRDIASPRWTACPLVAISRLKSNAILSLGLGLRGQRALFRAIAKKVSSTLNVLHEFTKTEKYQDAMDKNRPYLAGLPNGDETQFWYSIIDPQGAADTGVIIGCQNYSIAMSVVMAIRGITMEELYDEDETLRDAVADYSIHGPVLKILDSTAKDALAGNHALTTVYSTLCVNTESYALAEETGGMESVFGYVNLNTSLDINPGHLPVIEKELAQKFFSRTRKVIKNIGRPEDFHFLEAGRNDMSIFRVGQELLRKKKVRVVPTSTFIKLNRDFFKHLSDLSERGTRETGVLDVFTTLTVPVPRIVDENRSNKICPEPTSNHIATLRFLTRLRSHVCNSSSDIGSPVFDLSRLDSSLNSMGTPSSLRYAIKYLYETYANCIGDPYLLDCVLDLQDAFSTLYLLVTEVLQSYDRLRKRECDDVSSIVDAISNSLIHRIAMNGPKNETRDTAIDFRGGLNQIVHGIDVPIKAGLDLLRWRRFVDEGTKESLSSSRREISAITRLSFNPETTCRRHSFGKNGRYCLSQIDVNVSHMCDPIECLYYFHEIAHLIHDYCFEPTEAREQYMRLARDRLLSGDPYAEDDISTMSTRIEEVYAGYMTLLFVFGLDTDTFLRHFFSRWSTSAYSSHETDEDTLVDLTEKLIWGFCIADPAILLNAAKGGANSETQSEYDAIYAASGPVEFSRGDARIRAAVHRFEETIERYGIFFSGFDRLWNGVSRLRNRRYIVHQFVDVMHRTLPLLREEWNRALEDYHRFAKSARPWRLGYGLEERKRLAALIKGSLGDGDPFIVDRIRDAFEDNPTWKGGDEKRTGQVRDPDDLMFVCDLLHAYADLCYDDIRATHLIHWDPRRKIAGDSSFQGVEFNNFVLQYGSPGVVAIDPVARSQHLLWRIVTHKKLWDMSTDLRAQRLLDLTRSMDRAPLD